jgi:predicted negative regulator of RcsB-dependent stress response|tara:strand:- start:143 stop:787 length:645 start_codon:yes stop_codon:yes gene_type:complete
MDEDISIIDSKTRNEKIKIFFINNKKYLIAILSSIILIVFAYFSYGEIQDRKMKKLAEKYNNISIKFSTSNKTDVKNELIEIINEKNSTYSPLALYFIIDNEIQSSNEEINKFFDIIINEVNLNKEIKNLIIYKKGLFNASFETENNLIKILNPIINSDSVWKSHALYLLAEYFFDKNQKQKAKEFYSQILDYKKSNENILTETRKRLSRDFSE